MTHNDEGEHGLPDSVTITDNRTGASIEIPIIDGGVSAADFSKLLPGVWFYDPGFSVTAACESAITYIDGEQGILHYRGYPIAELAEKSTYLEVAYLLLNGELPTSAQYAKWVKDISTHTFIHENVRKRFLEGFHYDAHPMGMFVSALAALSTFYPEAKNVFDESNREMQITRLIAKSPTLAAAAYRFSRGMPFVYPDDELSFPANFLSMMWKTTEPRFEATLFSFARSTSCSSCTPTTSRTVRQRPCASLGRPKPIPILLVLQRRPDSMGHCTGARTSPC